MINRTKSENGTKLTTNQQEKIFVYKWTLINRTTLDDYKELNM